MIPRSVRDDLKSRQNVVGVGVGPKEKDGEQTDEEAAVVLVTEKKPEAELDDADIVPQSIFAAGEALQTDVIEVGDVRIHQERKRRIRPAPAGVSIGHPDITAGTLGSPPVRLVWKGGDNSSNPLLLTNAHVAAPDTATDGDACLQPGPYDGGDGDDAIAELFDYTEISKEGKNISDSALVDITDPSYVRKNQLLGVGPLIEMDTGGAEFGTTYTKSGRTSGVTEGSLRARDVELDVRGYFEDGTKATFTGMDVFGGMSAPGDSGSLIGYTGETAAGAGLVATNLLFAGSKTATIGIPLDQVLEAHDGGDFDVVWSPDHGETPKEKKRWWKWLKDFLFGWIPWIGVL